MTFADFETTSAPPERLLAAPKAAEQLGITRRTLGRWLEDAEMRFPRPVRINGRLYFRQHEVEVWKLERVRRGSCDREAA